MQFQVSKGHSARLAAIFLFLIVLLQLSPVLIEAQNLGGAPATNKAVQGQTAAQPEGAFLNLVNWVGNVIAPVGAALCVVMANWGAAFCLISIPMRYPKGSVVISGAGDIPLLRMVRNCRFVSHQQLFELLQ